MKILATRIKTKWNKLFYDRQLSVCEKVIWRARFNPLIGSDLYLLAAARLYCDFSLGENHV